METTQYKTTRPYLRFDFELASLIGTSATLVLATLIDHYEYFESKKQLKDGKFFNTKEMIASKTNLTSCAILKAEKLLIKIGYISVSKRSGTAGKLNDYTIHFDRLNQSLESIKPILKTDSTDPKAALNRSLGPIKPILRTDESTQISIPNNEPKEMITEEGNQIINPNYYSDEYWNTFGN
jgi:hypothetical protein